jgi:hypothetical protein
MRLKRSLNFHEDQPSKLKNIMASSKFYMDLPSRFWSHKEWDKLFQKIKLTLIFCKIHSMVFHAMIVLTKDFDLKVFVWLKLWTPKNAQNPNSVPFHFEWKCFLYPIFSTNSKPVYICPHLNFPLLKFYPMENI